VFFKGSKTTLMNDNESFVSFHSIFETANEETQQRQQQW
jgi:hypothetical protein